MTGGRCRTPRLPRVSLQPPRLKESPFTNRMWGECKDLRGNRKKCNRYFQLHKRKSWQTPSDSKTRASLAYSLGSLGSLGRTWTHLVSLGLTWSHLVSLGLIFPPSWSHLDSHEFSRTHHNSQVLTRAHWASLERNDFLGRM